MIVRILSRGRSFKGLANYLTHDAEAETTERVSWTHTHNLANDHVASAVDEMLWTARDAEILKMEAGIRGGGREIEKPVKHFSLNWAPGEEPTREHMIQAAEDFLRHMKWSEHQALFVAHEDKDYRHVHVMVNAVHPETGLKFDDNFEYRRAQVWAAEYERVHGLYCENRLVDEQVREQSPTRPAWMAFREIQKEFDENEKSRIIQAPEAILIPENAENKSAQEWKFLKEIQREEREGFFLEGKSAFKEMRSEIFREVREEFRERWSNYYDLKERGMDADDLKDTKAELVADQKKTLEQRGSEASLALRGERTELYQELLAGQREMRHGLKERQDAGFDSLHLIESFRVDPSRYTVERASDDSDATEWNSTRRTEPQDELAVGRVADMAFGGVEIGAAIFGSIADEVVSVAGDVLEFFAGGGSPSPMPNVPLARKPAEPDKFSAIVDEAKARAVRDAELEEQRRRRSEQARSQL